MKSALLVMDVQNAIVKNIADASTYIPVLQQAIQAARKADIPVIYVRVAFREGFPEVSSSNKSFSQIKKHAALFSEPGATDIHADVAPEKEDITVIKRRVSAFTGSDLEVVLRGQEIKQIVLTGIATSGVVLSTLREAADKDFHITVLSDACADSDEEVHRILTTKVFPRQADVMTVDEWIQILNT